ncbi:MAG: glutathione S-transferase family protein, partial [Gammaproteobacteria bacterium]|nr:glutathione S-transferase family protein [Gammaproteobacteria bacterium]
MKHLILYGVPFSQPVRAVMWLLLLKHHPFEMVLINPGSSGNNGSRHPDYLAKNPGGTIPCIEEPETGFTLAEAHAILTYLARINGWTDVYPEDEQERAKVDWYLHFHHRNIRDASLGLVAPKIRKDLDIPELIQENARRTLTSGLSALESGWLSDNKFLVGDSVTLADLAAYAEIGQLQPQFTNVYDLSPFPKVQRWLNDMMQVEHHDT